MLSFRHSYANITKFRNKFDSIFVVAGTKTNADDYYSYLRTKKEYYDLATQYDVRYDMDSTIKYLERERKEGALYCHHQQTVLMMCYHLYLLH